MGEMARKIVWTSRANNQVLEQFKLLNQNWTTREATALSKEIKRTTILISKNPHLFKESSKSGLRVAVILKLNKLYYRVLKDEIRIIAFYPSRKKPIA